MIKKTTLIITGLRAAGHGRPGAGPEHRDDSLSVAVGPEASLTVNHRYHQPDDEQHNLRQPVYRDNQPDLPDSHQQNDRQRLADTQGDLGLCRHGWPLGDDAAFHGRRVDLQLHRELPGHGLHGFTDSQHVVIDRIRHVGRGRQLDQDGEFGFGSVVPHRRPGVRRRNLHGDGDVHHRRP